MVCSHISTAYTTHYTTAGTKLQVLHWVGEGPLLHNPHQCGCRVYNALRHPGVAVELLWHVSSAIQDTQCPEGVVPAGIPEWACTVLTNPSSTLLCRWCWVNASARTWRRSHGITPWCGDGRKETAASSQPSPNGSEVNWHMAWGSELPR